MSQNQWDEFAKQDAEFYIYSVEEDFKTEEGRTRFFLTGKREVERIVSECDPYLTDFDVATEIGCGIGRLAIPMAARFKQVVAVDVSPTMLERLQEECLRSEISNVTPFLPDEEWWHLSADLVYSFLVFQHIREWEIINRYLDQISRALKPRGVAHLQFDTRPHSFAYFIRALLPDRFLPRTQRRGIRRIRRSTSQLTQSFDDHGLRIVREFRAESRLSAFLLTRK